MTLGDVLKRNNGVGPGFDLVRVGLALLILYGHCFWIAGTAPAPAAAAGAIAAAPGLADDAEAVRWTPLLWEGQRQIREMLVPMFFALSGFLVTGSAFRTNSLRTFLAFRVLRIAPALTVEITLSALVLGPLLTTFPLALYFTDPKFFEYFGNIVGLVRFELPGLFHGNPLHAVNINLWTLPGEFYCYLITAALMVAGLLANRLVFTALFAVATVMLVVARMHFGYAGRGTVEVIYYFFCGCLLFHWREKVPFTPLLFVAACIGAYGLYLSKQYAFAPLFVTYVVVFVGLMSLPRIPLLQSGDYSYGIYLYGFPIAQAFVAAIPALRGNGWMLLALATTATFAFAILSWHVVEKPTLLLKKKLAPSAARVTSQLVAADRQSVP